MQWTSYTRLWGRVRIRTFIILSALVGVAASGFAPVAHSQILVPDDYSTLQAAIDAATDGDTIIASAGTYAENLHLNGKDIVLRSTDPTNPGVVNATIIDGGQAGSVVSLAGTETEACVISGFTITNGKAQFGGGINGNKATVSIIYNNINNNIVLKENYYGGGGGINDCNGLIENNIITQNSSDYEGGGLSNCDGEIRNNQITNNIADLGAGLSSCNGAIRNNSITGNYANGGSVMGMGGGLRHCNGEIVGNLIADNIADDSGGGLVYCSGLIQGNQIIDNESHDEGGGLESCNGIIRNNLIAGNSALDGTGYGGGIADSYGTIINNTIVANHCEKKGGGLHDCKGFIANNIIWANTATDETQLSQCSKPFYSCVDDPAIEGIELDTRDPQFVDFDNEDYHLSATSWCIDAAWSYYLDDQPQTDIDGQCRWAGAAVDIGCDETGSAIDADGDILADTDEPALSCNPALVDTDGDGLMDGLEVRRQTNPAVADSAGTIEIPAQIASIQQALCLAFPGDVISIDAGTYEENLRLTGREVVIQSHDPSDQAVIDATIIDGRNVQTTLTFQGDETAASALSGLTIRNGNAPRYGGGINGNGSDATIEYCRIKENYAANDGGGIHRFDGQVLHNIIEENRAYTSGGGLSSGGGVIEYNLFLSNTAERDDGGGIAGAFNSVIRYNIFQSNYARDDGGAIKDCRGMIANNLFISNTADSDGGAIYDSLGTCMNNIIKGNQAANHGGAMGDFNGDIRNNLIVDNVSTNTSGTGDSAALFDCRGMIQNNTIVNNQAQTGGAAMVKCQAIIINCIVWGNTSSDNIQMVDCSTPLYCCIEGWTGGGPGNITSNPGFVAQDDLFHLGNGSSCIDAGNTYYLMGDYYFDIDKQCRLHGSLLDIGADEYGSETDDDGDLLSNSQETALDLKLDDPDTDGDGLKDGVEVLRGTDPKVPQTAGELHIPADYPTIQQAIFLAMPNETIILAQGTYYENLLFLGRNLVLQSTEPANENVVNATILDGGEDYACITMTGLEDDSSAIRGLTIRNGASPQNGGGIDGNGSEALIEFNRITNNTSKWHGGGIGNCSGTIQYNTITNNSCPYTFGSGGGLSGCSGWIHHNVITGNWVEGSLARGGGLAYCYAIIEYNTISNNRSSDDGGGLYLCNNIIRFNTIADNEADSGAGLKSCDGLIQENTISRNIAAGDGGGLSYCNGGIKDNIISQNQARKGGGLEYCRATIIGNTIELNEASEKGGGLEDCNLLIDGNEIHHNTSAIDGGGLYGCNGTIRNNLIHHNTATEKGGGMAACNQTIQNNTIVFNTSGVEGGGLCECTTEAVNCIVWGNTAPADPQATTATTLAYCCMEGFVSGGTGNHCEDPGFVNSAEADFHLLADSACVDAGQAIAGLTLDFDGIDRGFDGTEEARGDGSDYDMGALEYFFKKNAAGNHWILFE